MTAQQRRAGRNRTGVALTLACAALVAAGCTSDAEPTTEVDASKVEEVSVTDVDVDSQAQVGLPSGVLTLGVAPELESVASESGDLTPGAETTLLGVTWSFEPHPSSDARDVLLNGGDPQSLPQPSVVLVDGADSVPVPVVASSGRSGALVIGVKDPTALEVDFDGLTQTVDVSTGVVGAGRAEGLLDLRDATTSVLRRCPAADFTSASVLDNGCRVEAVHTVPYIEGLGWAPDSQTWLVVDARIDGEATMLLGDDPGTVLDASPQNVQRVAFAVAGDSPRSVTFDFGRQVGVISVPLPS